ncbi:hypothetical protein O7614_22590 [Micromonospora sp. WMMD961]|uniref:hypothetical protein n=1 Tax=Micromonospora sp. WMMD961 TaxID=3016100 RepID=UPI0024172280|nr:hypothetical protein [Micromonospora sp. WMMD961]MDG4782453.1 hypothetical protein [Micromonospora sp. WMMD961]
MSMWHDHDLVEVVLVTGVLAACGQQFVVRAGFDEASVTHDQDAIGDGRRGQAMGDDQDGALAANVAEPPQESHLAKAIEGGGWLVKHPERGVAVEHAGQGQPLPLADGQIAPVGELLAEQGAGAVGQGPDEPAEACVVEGGAYPDRVGRLLNPAECHDVGHGELIASVLLKQGAGHASHSVLAQLPQFDPVVADRASIGGEQPEQQGYQGGLAGTVTPHDRHDLARADGQVEVVNALRTARVGVGDTTELDRGWGVRSPPW